MKTTKAIMSKNMKQIETEIAKIRSEMITADKAAEIIGVTRDTLLRYRKNGILNCVKAGGRVLYRFEDVRNFLTGNNQTEHETLTGAELEDIINSK